MIRFFIFTLTLCTVVFGAKINTIAVKIDHRDPSFDGTVNEGRHLLLLPIIIDNHFIKSPSFQELSKPIHVKNDRVIVQYYTSLFESSDSITQTRMLRFEKELLSDNRLQIPTLLNVFETLDQRFVQTFRVVSASTVIDNHKKRQKHLTLETEIWDIRKFGVVFRVQASVESTHKKVSDTEIILRCVELLYGTLPKFYFNSSQRNW